MSTRYTPLPEIAPPGLRMHSRLHAYSASRNPALPGRESAVGLAANGASSSPETPQTDVRSPTPHSLRARRHLNSNAAREHLFRSSPFGLEDEKEGLPAFRAAL